MVWIVHQDIAAAIARCIGIFTEITGFFIHVPGLVNIHLVWPMSMVVEFYYSSPNSRHFFSQNDSGHVLLKQIMMTLRDVFTILPCYTYMLHMCDEDHTKHQCWRSSFAEAWLFKSFGWFKKPLAILQHDGWGRQEAYWCVGMGTAVKRKDVQHADCWILCPLVGVDSRDICTLKRWSQISEGCIMARVNMIFDRPIQEALRHINRWLRYKHANANLLGKMIHPNRDTWIMMKPWKQ